MLYFKNKVIWLTGASSGIGKALAFELAKHGAKLILSARKKDLLERIKEECISIGALETDIECLTLDLKDSFSLFQKAKEAQRLFGTVDMLINNAGVSHRSSIADTDISVHREIMEINYFGAISLSKYLLPAMMAEGSGHQVIICSVAGKVSLPNRSAYAASKHAQVGFYEAMQREVKHSGITVSIVYPGYVKTNLSLNALDGNGDRHGVMDKTQKNGLTASYCAKKICIGISQKEEAIVIGGLKERIGLFLERMAPRLLGKMLIKKNISGFDKRLN